MTHFVRVVYEQNDSLNESLDELEKSVHYMQGRLNGNK